MITLKFFYNGLACSYEDWDIVINYIDDDNLEVLKERDVFIKGEAKNLYNLLVNLSKDYDIELM